MKALDSVSVPYGVVTETDTVPAAWAGAVTVSCVALFTTTEVAGVDPNITEVAPVRFVPVIVTPAFVAPAVPKFGETPVTSGGSP